MNAFVRVNEKNKEIREKQKNNLIVLNMARE